MLRESPVAGLAPGRGQYDRALSRGQRQAEQRERLLLATAKAVAAGTANVGAVIELAGVGRNTFYEYFDDIEHAIESVRGRALSELETNLERRLGEARTPIDRLRTVCGTWFDFLETQPEHAGVILDLGRPASGGLTPAGVVLRDALARAKMVVAGTSKSEAPMRILAVVAVAQTFALTFLHQQSMTAAGDDVALTSELRANLTDVAIRLLH